MQNINKVWITLTLITILFLTATTTALIQNPTIPNLDQPKKTSTTIFINETLFNTNSSRFWGNYLWSNYNMPVINSFGYNQTTPANTYTDSQISGLNNSTIVRAGNYNCTGSNVLQNITINSSGAYGQCVAVSSGLTYNLTYDNHINNGTIHNSTFLYNQTTPAITDINSRFWNITQTWNITQLYNITQINSFNSSWSSTFNLTYNNLLNQNCPAGKVLNGTLINGTFICTTVSSSASSPTNWLNTSINMFINKSYPQSLLINNSGNFTVIGERCIGIPDTCLSYGEGNEAGCLAHGGCFFNYNDACDNGDTAPCCFGTAILCNKYSTTTCSGQDGCLIGNDTVFEVRTTEGDLFGTGSVALAGGDTFGSKGSVAMGLDSKSEVDNCIAIGKGAVCTGDGGFAFGSGSYAAADAFSVKANVGARSIGIGCEVGTDAICIATGIANVQSNVIVLGKDFTAIDEEHSIQFGFDNLLLKLNLTTTEVYNNLVTKNVTATQYHNQLISVYTLIGTTGNTECNYIDNAIAGVTWTCQTCIDTGGTARTCGATLVTLNANCLCKED